MRFRSLFCLTALLAPPAAHAYAPVQTLQYLESSLKKVCNWAADEACPESIKKVESHRKELEKIYASEKLQAALSFIYQKPDNGQAGLRDKAKENYRNALEQTDLVKKSIDRAIITLAEREKAHSDSNLKATIKISRAALDGHSKLLANRLAALNNAIGTLNSPEANLDSLHSSVTGLQGVTPEELGTVKSRYADVNKKIDEFISDPGKGTGTQFLDAARSFCKQPGSLALAATMKGNCQSQEKRPFGVFAGWDSSVDTVAHAANMLAPAMMLASGASRAGVEKRIREIRAAAEKIVWDTAESTAGSRARVSGSDGTSPKAALPLTALQPPAELPQEPSSTDATASMVKAAITAGSSAITGNGVHAVSGSFADALESGQLQGVHASRETSLFEITHSVMRQKWRTGAFRPRQ